MPEDWLVVALRFGLYVALTVPFGVAFFGIHAMQPDDRNSTLARRYVCVVGFATALGIVLSLVSMVVMAKAMAGVDTYAELTAHVFDMILTATPVGLSWTVRVVALFAVLAAIALLRTRPALRFGALSILGAIALATLAWTGHGAMSDGALGALHLASDIAHLLAAGAWVGALFAFVVLSIHARGPSPATATHAALLGRTADGFARVGTMIVVTLTLTGLLNYGLIVGPTVDGLLTTAYGRLLVAKLALFAGMLALAAANRYRLSPRLALALQNGDHAAAVTTLRRSLTTETSLALAVLALVSWLGALSPPGA